MGDGLLNFSVVERGATRCIEASELGSGDGQHISNKARRRFMQGSVLLALSPSLSVVGKSLPELCVRRTSDGFALLRHGVVVWMVSTAWFSGRARVALRNSTCSTEVTLSGATLPGTAIRCDMRMRMTIKNGCTRIEMEHGLADAVHEVDLEDWLNGEAALPLGRRQLALQVTVGAYASLNQSGVAECFLQPDLGLHLRSPGAFEVTGRELQGRLDDCVVRPADDTGERLINTHSAHAMRVVLNGNPESAVRIRPQQTQSSLRCGGGFETTRVVFEVHECANGEPQTGYLADAVVGVPLRLHATRTSHNQPRVTLIANGLSFGRVASAIPVSMLSARTSLAHVSAENLVLSGRCVDDQPLRLVENDDVSTHMARSVVWTDGTLRDEDGVSARLRFRDPPDANHQHDISEILDAVPWHKKSIALDNVVVEFMRAADGLWLRAQLQGYVLKQRVGRFFVTTADSEDTRPRLKWVLPAQSFSEEAYFQAPPPVWNSQQCTPNGVEVSKAGIPYGDADANARQEINGTDARLQRERPEGDSEPIPLTAVSALRVAGESILVFVPASGWSGEFELSLSALLDPKHWKIHVAPEARSDESAWRRALDDANRHGRDEYTRLELPWRVDISPDQHSRIETSPLVLERGKCMHPLFFMRPVAGNAQSNVRLPLRAIASKDHFDGLWWHYGTPPHRDHKPPMLRDCADPVRTNLDEQDRNELVWLSGTWGQFALLGTANVRKRTGEDPVPVVCDKSCDEFGVYVPQPFYADRLLLTSFGASLRSQGTWDPPSFHLEDTKAKAMNLAMSIEEWTHMSTLARPHFDRVVYRGFVLPYGFRVALIKITVREIRPVGRRGLMAVPLQRYFLRVEEGEKVFPAALGQPLESRNGFFQPERFKLALDRDLQIEDPSDPLYSLAGMGASAFWVRTPDAAAEQYHENPSDAQACAAPSRARAPHAAGAQCNKPANHTGKKTIACYPFPIAIGADGLGAAPLAFVSNAIVHDVDMLNAVVREFNCFGGSLLDAKGSRMTYAPSVRTGDTRFVTHTARIKVVVNTALVNSALLEEQHLPPFFPILETAEVELDAIQRATAQADRQLTTVAYAELYKAVGFTAKPGSAPNGPGTPSSATLSNPAEIFLTFGQPVRLSYSNGGERSGGVATPNMQPNAMSRKRGLLSGFTDIHAAGSPGVSAAVRRILNRRAKMLKALGPVAEEIVAQDTPPSGASTAGGFGNPFSLDAKLLGIVPLSTFFEAVGLGDLPSFIDSIEEGISESLEHIAEAAQAFGGQIDNAVQRIEALLPAHFYDSDAGRSIKADLERIDAAANSLGNGDPSQISTQVSALSAQIRRLRDDFQAIADHPETLLSVDGIADLVKKAAEITTILTSNLDEFRKRLAAAAVSAARQFDDYVTQLQDNAEQNLNVLSEGFTELVLSELAAHRTDLLNIEAALNTGLQVRDTFVRLSRLAGLYRQLYIDGFGLQDALATIASHAIEPLAGTIAALLKHVKNLRDNAGDALKTCQADLYGAVFDFGFTVDTAWHACQESRPALAKQLAPAFSDLAQLLNTYTTAAKGQDSPPSDPLELFNRAHRLLSRIEAALEAAKSTGDFFDAAATTALNKLQDRLGNACNCIMQELAQVAKDLADLHAQIDAQSPLYEVELALDQFAFGTMQLLDHSKAGAGTGFERALTLCEAFGNLLDRRLLGAASNRANIEAVRLMATQQQVLAALATTSTEAWRALRLLLEPVSTIHLDDNKTITDILGHDFIAITNEVAEFACTLVLSFDDDGKRAADCEIRRKQSKSEACQNVVCNPSQGEVVDRLDLAHQIGDTSAALGNWVATLQKISTTVESSALEEIKGLLDGLVQRMIPTKTQLDFGLKKELSDYGGVFIGRNLKGTNANLELSAHIEADLIARTQSSRFSGTLTSFQILLFGVVDLEVVQVHFEANDGRFHLDQPDIGKAKLGGNLEFVNAFEGLMNGTSGPFVEPAGNGIRAGYRLSFPITQLGPFTVQNFGFEVAIEIPFDDRAALISIALATADAPCLISFGVYGGGAYFAMSMAGTKLVSIEAAFEYGLVGAFSFPMVEGTGRVVVGLYFGIEASVAILRGYFYAGGHATVLDFVSISADLRLSLTYDSKNGASGEGHFHVEIGAGPFSWTLSYTVTHAAKKAALEVDAVTQRLVATSSDVTGADLLDEKKWEDYRAVFALDDLKP